MLAAIQSSIRVIGSYLQTNDMDHTKSEEEIKNFELEHQIVRADDPAQSSRRYIRIPVKSGFKETLDAVQSFREGISNTKMIHGVCYEVIDTSQLPTQFLEGRGELTNRSTDNSMADPLFSVYEYQAPTSKSTELFFVKYKRV